MSERPLGTRQRAVPRGAHAWHPRQRRGGRALPARPTMGRVLRASPIRLHARRHHPPDDILASSAPARGPRFCSACTGAASSASSPSPPNCGRDRDLGDDRDHGEDHDHAGDHRDDRRRDGAVTLSTSLSDPAPPASSSPRPSSCSQTRVVELDDAAAGCSGAEACALTRRGRRRTWREPGLPGRAHSAGASLDPAGPEEVRLDRHRGRALARSGGREGAGAVIAGAVMITAGGQKIPANRGVRASRAPVKTVE